MPTFEVRISGAFSFEASVTVDGDDEEHAEEQARRFVSSDQVFEALGSLDVEFDSITEEGEVTCVASEVDESSDVCGDADDD